MNTRMNHIVIFFALIAMTACSMKASTPNDQGTKQETGCSNCTPSPVDPDPDPGKASLQDNDLQGDVKNGLLDGTQLIAFNKTTKMFEIRIPYQGFTINELPATIPNVPGSRLSVVYDSNSGFYMVLVEIPGAYVLGKMGFSPGQFGKDPQKLPNGNPIPQTPGGEPPKISFVVPNVTPLIQVYLGINVVGVYIESKVNPTVDISFPIKNRGKIIPETIGYFSLVRQKAPFLGGFFVSLIMPNRIAALLDEFLAKFVVGSL